MSRFTTPHCFRWIAAPLGAIIFTVGICGNILVVIVIAQTKFMRTTTNCYLVSLAIADCIVLLSATLPSIPEPFFQIDEWPFGRVMCSMLVFLQYVGVNASSLSITAFTVERYIAICFPIKAQTLCTISRAKRIIICLWIFTTLYCCPWLGLTEIRVDRQVVRNVEKCVFRLKRQSYLVLLHDRFDHILRHSVFYWQQSFIFLLDEFCFSTTKCQTSLKTM